MAGSIDQSLKDLFAKVEFPLSVKSCKLVAGGSETAAVLSYAAWSATSSAAHSAAERNFFTTVSLLIQSPVAAVQNFDDPPASAAGSS